MEAKNPTEIIRQATIEDIEAIFSIWQAGQASAMGDMVLDNAKPDEEIKKVFLGYIEQQTDNFKVWIYEKDGIVIAWSSILPFHPNPLLKDVWGIISMYIHPDYQNHIYGYLFSKHILNAASGSSLKYVISIVATDNERIKRLSLKMGFVSMGLLPKTKDDNSLALLEIMIFET